MKTTTLALAAILYSFLGWHTAASSEPIKVKGTRVSIEQPANFLPATNFSGFVDKATQSNIMVTELPAPFEASTAGFDENGLATRGMKLISREKVTVGEYPGLLLSVKQTAYGTDFAKWILAFGDSSETIVVTASFPDADSDKLSSSLKENVLSARFDAKAAAPDPMADLPFTASGTKSLLLAGRIQNTILFSPTGKITAIDPTDHSLFLIGQAFSDLDISDRSEFARTRLKMTAGLGDIKILSEKDSTVAEFPAREILATGVDKQGQDLFVMQIMAFGRGSYFFLQGLTDAEQREKKEPEFREIVSSFKMKPADAESKSAEVLGN